MKRTLALFARNAPLTVAPRPLRPTTLGTIFFLLIFPIVRNLYAYLLDLMRHDDDGVGWSQPVATFAWL